MTQGIEREWKQQGMKKGSSTGYTFREVNILRVGDWQNQKWEKRMKDKMEGDGGTLRR